MVDLVDEEHSKDFEELKEVAEAAQGVSDGRQVLHCTLHSPSESLSVLTHAVLDPHYTLQWVDIIVCTYVCAYVCLCV